MQYSSKYLFVSAWLGYQSSSGVQYTNTLQIISSDLISMPAFSYQASVQLNMTQEKIHAALRCNISKLEHVLWTY